MLTTLEKLKTRLALIDTQSDQLLTQALQSLGPRFDSETNRVLTRTADLQQEFDPRDREIILKSYPVISVTKFELKQNEQDGWQEIPNVQYLIRHDCILSTLSGLSTLNSQPSIARITFTAGYILPEDPAYAAAPADQRLPLDLENAAIEQIAFWFMNREKLGLKTSWPSGIEYRQFATQDLLASVQTVLSRHRRFTF